MSQMTSCRKWSVCCFLRATIFVLAIEHHDLFTLILPQPPKIIITQTTHRTMGSSMFWSDLTVQPLTINSLEKVHAKAVEYWETLDARKEIDEVFDDGILTQQDLEINQAICAGLGNLNDYEG